MGVSDWWELFIRPHLADWPLLLALLVFTSILVLGIAASAIQGARNCKFLPAVLAVVTGKAGEFGPPLRVTAITWFALVVFFYAVVNSPLYSGGKDLDALRELGIVARPDHDRQVPQMKGTFYIQSFFHDTAGGSQLILCREKVLITKSSVRLFDYEYETAAQAGESDCGNPYTPWHGYLTWSEPHHAFVDLAHDTKNPDLLLGYMSLPYSGTNIHTSDGIGYEVGTGDYGEPAVANPYVLSEKPYTAEQVLQIIQSGTSARIFQMTAPSQGTLSCPTRAEKYGNAVIAELAQCAPSRAAVALVTVGGVPPPR